MKSDSADFGKFAEQLAAEYLVKKGYTVQERNWRPKSGHLEVDIICRRDDTIIFVEVKARSGDSGDPAKAVDFRKRRHLCNAADSYMRSLGDKCEYRFDIVTVWKKEDDDEAVITDHLEDAFLAPLSRAGSRTSATGGKLSSVL